MKLRIRASILLAWLLSLGLCAACHTIQFDVSDQPESYVVSERRSFFLWGIVAWDRDVDVQQHCPAGVAAIREQTSITDGLITLPFLGLWTLRSSWYYCLPPDPNV